ncbi:TIGR04222 domain-containing membrane protein [Methylocystis sp. WRRC1]|uniref:TIGR04222 domain-containing membrane protein n=1 Tax=Methylocystis sp. WRRC1 TaxID=1732014 RepID=UPI001D141FB5|nr:TIGR04222 domain-containing membrane protein [Methylocystis sp. WRRC1]MCC3244189.1 TIGR04222 domain-containing membrane protein [Methylocystis sp. WRRC1]
MQDLPFFNLSGPEFLNFFGVVVIAVLATTFLVIHFADRSGRRPPPPVPQTPDAMEVAYLQGGVNQVIRTLVYDLDERGFVVLGPESRIVPTGAAPQSGDMNALELRVLEAVRNGPTAQELLEDRALRNALEQQLQPVRDRLAADDLLQPPSVKVWRRRLEIIGAILIIAVAGVKLQMAFAEGQNVSYLLFLMVAAVAALFAEGYVLTRDAASRRGQAYLEAMRVAYADRLKEALAHIRSPGPEARAFKGASLFLIALYGFSMLKGTTEAKFPESFERASGAGDD